MIWLIFALLTGAAVMAVLAPLAMRNAAPRATRRRRRLFRASRSPKSSASARRAASTRRTPRPRRSRRRADCCAPETAPGDGSAFHAQDARSSRRSRRIAAHARRSRFRCMLAARPFRPAGHAADRAARGAPPHADLSGAVARIERICASIPKTAAASKSSRLIYCALAAATTPYTPIRSAATSGRDRDATRGAGRSARRRRPKGR